MDISISDGMGVSIVTTHAGAQPDNEGGIPGGTQACATANELKQDASIGVSGITEVAFESEMDGRNDTHNTDHVQGIIMKVDRPVGGFIAIKHRVARLAKAQ
jgi:hypothetical protein